MAGGFYLLALSARIGPTLGETVELDSAYRPPGSRVATRGGHCSLGEDREARFAGIVRAHGSHVFGLIVRFVRDRALAEDLWQDVFLAVWRKIDDLEPGRDPLPYLRTLALNRAIDHVRRLRTRPAPETGLALDERSAPESARSLDFEDDLASLPAHERASILLYYQERRSIAEVAEALGVPSGTVKTWLFRARARLRKRFQPIEGERSNEGRSARHR